MTTQSDSTIVQFFARKNIFLTGGTGFVGVCLIEKLLRSVPDIGKIYLLMRPKKGKEIQERLLEVQQNSVFDKLKEEKNEEELKQLFSKLHAIAGEISEQNLGISPSDRQLLIREVNIVFHSAATLDFEATLRPTVQINLLGTRRITELCSEIQNLNCLVHVSSAYVNSWKLYAEEVIYPLNEDPEKVIKMVNELNDEQLKEATPKLLGDHPNTYTFTKHMAEHEIVKCESKFPCTIVRPSMITASWKEPMPGWTISKNGPQGFLMGASKGVIRRLPVASNLIYDYIPVDSVINTLIVAAVHVATFKPNKVEIYQATSSTRKPFKWSSVEDKINGYLHKYPLKSAVWYPHLKLLPSITWFKISALFVHILPAIILDFVTRISGGRPILMKLHRNVNTSLDLLAKFIFTEWTYPAVKTEELHNWLSTVDRKQFCVSLEMLDWKDYFISLTQGVRRYLSKENPRNLPAAKSKDTFLLVLHLSLQGTIYFLFWYLTASYLDSTLSKTALVIPVIYCLLSLL